MKNKIRNLILKSEGEFIDEMDSMVKEEVSRAVHRTRFLMLLGFVLAAVIYQFIIK